MSLQRMREELRRKYERISEEEERRERARLKAMLKYYEPIEGHGSSSSSPSMRRELQEDAKTINEGNPNYEGRLDFLELLISTLREHEKSLDELISKGELTMETETKRLEDLTFRLEEAVRQLERIKK